MNTSESFFRQFPELRGADPDLLRELIADREAFDELVYGDEEITPAEQARLDAIKQRVRARLDARAKQPAAPRGHYLATPRGWLPLNLENLSRIAAGIAVAGTGEFLASVLQSVASHAQVMGGGSLAVELVDPANGASTPTDECTISSLEPWSMAPGEGGAMRLLGAVAFDFVFDEVQARRLDGGLALACIVSPDGGESRCVSTRLLRDGTRLVARFDAVLPGVTSVSSDAKPALRYRLVPPGEAAEAVLRA